MSNKKILIGAIFTALIGGGLIYYFTFRTTTLTNTQPGNTNTIRSNNPISTQSQLGSSNSNSGAPVPKFIADPNKFIDSTKKLTPEEKERLSTFVGNIAGLIQTFGYDDYNNITALTDYFTPKGKTYLESYLAEVQGLVKPGYKQRGVADSSAKIGFYYSQVTNTYQATVDTNVYNVSNSSTLANPTQKNLEFDLAKDGSTWKINSIKYNVR